MGGGKLRGFMAKLRRDVRALSPIFAVLLLIAIAVIAGIIIYMYTSGYMASMMGGGTTGQEKVAIQAAEYVAGDIAVYAVNTAGGPDVVITGAILRDSTGNAVDQVSLAVTLGPGALVRIPAAGGLAFTYVLTPGETYTVALVSSRGNQFVSPSFKA